MLAEVREAGADGLQQGAVRSVALVAAAALASLNTFTDTMVLTAECND